MKTDGKNSKSEKKNPVQRLIREWADDTDAIKSDVNGSYTGTPEHGEHPVQDADDL
ncbi:MAG: hypothetical protein GX051_07800 [Clostridiales bacterium]|nr:hypothetical protein [Clostridiales bacterium]